MNQSKFLSSASSRASVFQYEQELQDNSLISITTELFIETLVLGKHYSGKDLVGDEAADHFVILSRGDFCSMFKTILEDGASACEGKRDWAREQ